MLSYSLVDKWMSIQLIILLIEFYSVFIFTPRVCGSYSLTLFSPHLVILVISDEILSELAQNRVKLSLEILLQCSR